MVGAPFGDPRFVKAFRNLEQAIRFQQQGLVDEADKLFSRLIKKNPHYFDAYHQYALFKYRQGSSHDALRLVEKAVKIDPRSADALNSMGIILSAVHRHERALASFDAALAINQNFVLALGNRSNSLNELGRYEEAIKSADRALALEPRYANAYIPRGAALLNCKRYNEALESYEMAIAHDQDFGMAWVGRGNCLVQLSRHEEALASYDRALALKTAQATLEGARLFTKMHLCNWKDYDADCARLMASIRSGNLAAAPFPLLSLPSSREDQLQVARMWASRWSVPAQPSIWRGPLYKHDRIRVAYLSSDFGEHPVSFLLAGLFECHDKSKFEISAISTGPDDNSGMRKRLEASFDRFYDASRHGDGQIVKAIKDQEVDILVDLSGFTAGSRPGILAQRAAPVQVNYLGYPATMGASYIDYILADPAVIPESSQKDYSEKVVHLPGCFMANDARRKIAERLPLRSEFGLPESGFVFCSFNQSYKIAPKTFDIWMRLLRQIDNSVLWLSDTNEAAIRNLRHEAQNRGVNPDRIVFAQRVARNEDHLARLRLGDLFLDTLPYNAHTTASDALWAGLPVLTQIGETFAGRVAASLLSAVGLQELIAQTQEQYESLAMDLATSPERLAAVKTRLAQNSLTMPLFNTTMFARHLESAYVAMYERHRQRMRAEYIRIPA